MGSSEVARETGGLIKIQQSIIESITENYRGDYSIYCLGLPAITQSIASDYLGDYLVASVNMVMV